MYIVMECKEFKISVLGSFVKIMIKSTQEVYTLLNHLGYIPFISVETNVKSLI